MKNWNKKNISKNLIIDFQHRFKIDALSASIFLRRGITKGNDIMYFLEDDTRFLHNPFLFKDMEDAVDRILDAKEENEKILIFGDRDVDGITSTALLYKFLSHEGMDVNWRLPNGNDTYGLSKQAIDDFAAEYGTLIITVDCGISNNDEIAYAIKKGIDVIVTDHHTPPGNPPIDAIIINPKLTESGYPFNDISGCATVFKLVSALRFSQGNLYKQEICLLNIRKEENSFLIECLKVRNLVKTKSLKLTINAGSVHISDTKLPSFLRGQQIFVWNENQIKNNFIEIFGNNIDLQMMDIRPLVTKMIPSVKNLDISAIKDMSKIIRYSDNPATEMDGFYNIFVTYMTRLFKSQFPHLQKEEENDYELVMLAAIADIMPLVNENRIFVKKGIQLLNIGKTCPGLTELLARLSKLGKKITSTDISWSVIPVLNAAGRLGQPELSLKLFLSEDPAERDSLSEQIIQLNKERKELVSQAEILIKDDAYKSFSELQEKLIVIINKNIHRGISGIIAARLMQQFKVPALIVTFIDDDTAVGSMRSCRNFSCTDFLDKFQNIFINHGGHQYAAGFSLNKSKIPAFLNTIKTLIPAIKLSTADSEQIEIDAELPPQYLTPDVIKIEEKFEPFGEQNPPLNFMTQNLIISDALILGKTERQHLKLTLDCGQFKWPSMFWGEAERLNKDFYKGDSVNIIYKMGINSFNGMETPQLIITDIHKITK